MKCYTFYESSRYRVSLKSRDYPRILSYPYTINLPFRWRIEVRDKLL